MKHQKSSIVVVVAATNAWFRQTIGQLLTARSLAFCIKEVGTREDTLLSMGQHPDVVVIDPFVVDELNLSLVQRLKQLFPQIPVIVLLPKNSKSYRETVAQHGANTVVVKDQLDTDLYPAIKNVLNTRRGVVTKNEQVQQKNLSKKRNSNATINYFAPWVFIWC